MNMKKMKQTVMEALKNSFKPEFLNRLDEIIVFHKLSDADIIRIIDIMLSQFAKRLESINMHIVFTDKLKMHIKQKGTNLEYGARPLKRTIQKEIEDNMSEAILKGEISVGDNVEVDVEDEKILFRKIN